MDNLDYFSPSTRIPVIILGDYRLHIGDLGNSINF